VNGTKFFIRGKPWMVTNQDLYALKDSEQIAWTAIEISDPLNASIVLQRNLKPGDLKLSPKSYKDYKKEDYRMEMQRSQARSFLLEMCPDNSSSRLAMYILYILNSQHNFTSSS